MRRWCATGSHPCGVDMRSRVYIETSVPSFYHGSHLTEINNRLGLFVPLLTTPESLFLEEIDDD